MVGTLQSSAAPDYTPSALTDSAVQTRWKSVQTITSAYSTSAAAADDGCTIFIGPSVQVYYHPDATAVPNTACLTGAVPQSSVPLPSGYSNLYFSLIFSLDSDTNGFCSASSSIYLIVPAISAGNSHRQVGNAYSSVTFSLAPGELSTIAGQNDATKAYDFADLPCPPSGVATSDWWFYNPSYNPGRPYEPRISIPPEVTNLDPAWSSCTATAQYQGFDPAISLPTANGMSGPGPGGVPRRFRRGAAYPLQAPAYANTPASTTMPLTALPSATMADDPDTMSLESPGRFRRAAQHPNMPPLAFPAATLVNTSNSEPAFPQHMAIALKSATTVTGPESSPPGSARRLRKAVGHVEREPERPEETYQPTKTFVA